VEQREIVTTTSPALCSDRDYVISQVMREESCHCITAGYAV
jgi:hypothetical protein